MKRDVYVQNGCPFIARSVAVHFPFAARFFFKRAPVIRIERGNFFCRLLYVYLFLLSSKLEFEVLLITIYCLRLFVVYKPVMLQGQR